MSTARRLGRRASGRCAFTPAPRGGGSGARASAVHLVAPARTGARAAAHRYYLASRAPAPAAAAAAAAATRPTFQFYLNGKKKHQFSGGDPNQLQQWAQKLATDAEKYDVQVSKEALFTFYKDVAPDKVDEAKIDELLAKAGEGGGPGHYKLLKKLEKKYSKKPETTPAENRLPKDVKEKKKKEEEDSKLGPRITQASLEELKAELEKRAEEAGDEAGIDDEDEAEAAEAAFPFFTPGDFPERVAIIGGGPAGLSAAIYASRAGLRPVIVAPPVGGQLQGKGVMVENYPAVSGVTGPTIVTDMQKQAAEFGTTFAQEMVESIDVSEKPFKIKTTSSTINAHTVILATGADSRWLGVEGEEQYRGGGVSSCATCDGFLFRDKEVVVIGGGDTAMEDALVLARTSSKVTVVHRRDSFRASHVLAERVLQNDKIEVIWNHTTVRFEGEPVKTEAAEGEEPEEVDTLTNVVIKDVNSAAERTVSVAAAFVAIGHIPNTGYVEGKVAMDANGYVELKGDGSTYTKIDGIFAAGDVADKVYRQAVTSAGSGAMAALDAERWLSEHGIGDEAAEFEAEMMREMLAEIEEEGPRETEEYPEAYKEPKPEPPKEEEPAKEAPKRAPAPAQGEDDDEEEVVEEEEEVAHTEL